MKQEFYDRYKKSLTTRLPKKKVIKKTTKRDLTPFQQWSRSKKSGVISNFVRAPLDGTDVDIRRQPLSDVQNIQVARQEKLSLKNSTCISPEKGPVCSGLKTVGPQLAIPVTNLQNALHHPQPTCNLNTQSPRAVTVQVYQNISSPSGLLGGSGAKICPVNQQSQPMVSPGYASTSMATRTHTFNDIIVENGNMYAESSTVLRKRWFYDLLVDLEHAETSSIDHQETLISGDLAREDPIIDPDLAYTLNESSIVVDMGHTSFYDVLPEPIVSDARETNIAGQFLHTFQEIGTLLRREKQNRKDAEKNNQNGSIECEIVFQGTEPWLIPSDLKNEYCGINCQSSLRYKQQCSVSPDASGNGVTGIVPISGSPKFTDMS